MFDLDRKKTDAKIHASLEVLVESGTSCTVLNLGLKSDSHWIVYNHENMQPFALTLEVVDNYGDLLWDGLVALLYLGETCQF